MTFLKLIRTYWVQILVITFIGAILRFWGILHGFQENYIYHPDAMYVLGDVWRLYLGGEWAIGTYAGPFYYLLLVYPLKLIEFITGFLGFQPEWSFEFIASVNSLVTATLGTLTIPIVYLLASKAYNKSSGILAALIFSVCPLHSFHSHYHYRDVLMVFFLCITLFLPPSTVVGKRY